MNNEERSKLYRSPAKKPETVTLSEFLGNGLTAEWNGNCLILREKTFDGRRFVSLSYPEVRLLAAFIKDI